MDKVYFHQSQLPNQKTMNFAGAPAVEKSGSGLYPAGYPNYAPTQPGMAHTLAPGAAPATHRQLAAAANQQYQQPAMPQNMNPSVYSPSTGVYSTLSPGYPAPSSGAFHPPSHPHAMQYTTFQSPSAYQASQYATPTYIGAPQLSAGAAYPMGIAVTNPHAPSAYNPSVASVPRAYTTQAAMSQAAMSQAAMSQAAMSQAAMSQMGYSPLGSNPLGSNPLGSNPLGSNPLGSNVPGYPNTYGFNQGYP
ncbi:ataxin-2 homolog isoform X1 [Mizuhopecten yessoensis]|nr:ataxin-2 homolog isoform X1 [Mizuhopecten yessoensis]XP_021375910.1 ataxin-2 homolog isoform X1 [Mizuhopecten yessoensis]XP_021375911.1 ataxin-2 homolog isoform X1 [Mizuhopecten yessoensis]